tara:strand:- start:71 stop:1504 length:1434 start_codon:yes stop_codon:yes gene_type:complete
MDGSGEIAERRKGLSYSGYIKRDLREPDNEITRAGPGTPLGEYLRRFWQPVCMSEQLKGVPLSIRIMNEELVAFRDKRGKVGVLHKHCLHRGASLEYGVIQEAGIRCCYHGFQFDVDGTILDIPGELDRGAKLCQTLSQGAYPAFEREGLVFAYMGPPEHKPPFPNWDAFEKHQDTCLVPFTNVFPCNWLQTVDNIADQLHTSILHQPVDQLYNGELPEGLDASRLTLQGFEILPVLDYMPLRDGTSMAFIACRRLDEQKVWVRVNECILPNMTQHAYLFEDGAERRLFHRVHMSRWYVPVDDTHSIIFGWRMFGKGIDPRQLGEKERVGWDKMDFLDAQVGHRSYEEGQLLPGDYEAIVGQRDIAIHALENPIASDVGVYMFRKLLRAGVNGSNPGASPEAMHARAVEGLPTHCYTQNSVLAISERPTEEEDRKTLKALGRRVVDAIAKGDAYVGEERDVFVRGLLQDIERGYSGA